IPAAENTGFRGLFYNDMILIVNACDITCSVKHYA
ncbi:unnamed protein product, partial [marine sediment metagenome]